MAYAQQAGKRFESELMKYLRSEGFDVERLRLAGKEDEGDLLVRVRNTMWPGDRRWVIEAKRTKSLDLAGWVKEAQVERANHEMHRDLAVDEVGFVVVHYARGKNISQSYVTTTLEEWLGRL